MEVKTNKLDKKPRYYMNDLNSVYTHWDPKTGKNVPTENKISEGVDKNNGCSDHKA